MPEHLTQNLKPHYLEDKSQNFWQVASIQGAAFGFPILNVGKNLAVEYGPGTALNSIWIGNLILWIIGLATVAMAYSERKNAIENLKEYIGKFGAILGGLILILAFIFWYTLQIRSSMSEMRSVLESHIHLKDTFDIRIGAALGLIISILSLGGIRFIKWFAVITFPLLIIFLIYAVVKNEYTPSFKGTWGISIAAIGFTIAVTLPGFVNLPTFFRHSRSRADAFFALTLVTIFDIFIESISIWLINDYSNASSLKFLSFDIINLFLCVAFIIISLIAINLVNIYFASASWEEMFPHIGGAKEYAIVGMVGTIAFTFVQVLTPMEYIENLTDSFIASLGIVLLIAFLVRRLVSHRQRAWELNINFICWLAGCAAAILVQKISAPDSSNGFFSGIGISSLLYLIFLFFEETIWSFRNSIRKLKLDK